MAHGRKHTNSLISVPILWEELTNCNLSYDLEGLEVYSWLIAFHSITAQQASPSTHPTYAKPWTTLQSVCTFPRPVPDSPGIILWFHILSHLDHTSGSLAWKYFPSDPTLIQPIKMIELHKSSWGQTPTTIYKLYNRTWQPWVQSVWCNGHIILVPSGRAPKSWLLFVHLFFTSQSNHYL